MKIVAISDTHGQLPVLPEADVCIIGGDVVPMHDHSTVFQRSWLETNFAQWLQQIPAKHILGIGGNHDFALERYPEVARSLPWTYLLDSGVTIDGVKFWGSPWVPNLSRWAFHHMDHVLDEKMALIPDGTDVVISHGPPYGALDFTVPKFGACHAGFPGLNTMLDRVQPALFVCGHIHEGYGCETRRPTVLVPTVLVNASHMTENYEPINEPWVVHLVPSAWNSDRLVGIVRWSLKQQRLNVPLQAALQRSRDTRKLLDCGAPARLA